MNHETKEQAAQDWALSQDGSCPACSESTLWKYKMDAFIAGASWREHQAASGFEEWLTGRFQVFNNTTLEQEEILYRTAWQASALHSAKLLAEKDAEIEKLRKERLELLEYKFMYEELCK